MYPTQTSSEERQNEQTNTEASKLILELTKSHMTLLRLADLLCDEHSQPRYPTSTDAQVQVFLDPRKIYSIYHGGVGYKQYFTRWSMTVIKTG